MSHLGAGLLPKYDILGQKSSEIPYKSRKVGTITYTSL